MDDRAFSSETKEFEPAVIALLQEHGWEDRVLVHSREADLIRNWADILFENNKDIDRLNNCPLTDSEMQQILEQIAKLKTPLLLNCFINGGSVAVKRDNPEDAAHLGREVSLKIYDRQEIKAGKSRYQIVRQPEFKAKIPLLSDRRGDLMLLINGMPVIHLELKKSNIPVSQAVSQIKKYAEERVFTGFFALVQVFAAMTPEETLYFANPGPDGKFEQNYYFHWADFNNEPINDWREICRTLLSIPMAHQLIGFYTVADASDGVLKVMRSYQYYAANAISDRVAKNRWEEGGQLGGYIWHTTGSGKTMTSFKSAQLIASSRDADKVVFMMDRKELGTQSLNEYRNFAGAGLSEEQKKNTVQETDNNYVLIGKLKSSDPADTLIVTSIQKMHEACRKDQTLKAADIGVIRSKRLVIIVDECHRSTFGDMLCAIKQTFPQALFFGFTGTPIQEENQKKLSTTATVFGSELHRYSLADGIRDKNVLGFDLYKVLTFKDRDIRRAVALQQAKAASVEEAWGDPAKKQVFLDYMHNVPMAGYTAEDGGYVKGIEDYLPPAQYRTEEHQSQVLEDIRENWAVLSQSGKFHAILATESIAEALEYYQRFKTGAPDLRVTALFDPSIDNNDGSALKEASLAEIIGDYNKRYGVNYAIPSFAKMKKDIAARLAHKNPYNGIDKHPEKQIDLLIVVDQMLTGFDSKWLNTLYIDKFKNISQPENIIQAFSRTNRLFGPDKPFGTIRYYRKPHTMEKCIEAAVKLYSGDRPFGLFAQRLDKNLREMNRLYREIEELFCRADGLEEGEDSAGSDEPGCEGKFAHLPAETADCRRFTKLFREFNEHLQAAKIQGFNWNKAEYSITDEIAGDTQNIAVSLDETTYLVLVKRYQELAEPRESAGLSSEDIPYDLDGYLTEIDTGRIDLAYMNSRFEKYLKALHTQGSGAEKLQKAEAELHKTFAVLSQEEQKQANIFLHELQSGDVEEVPGKLCREYISEYLARSKDDRIHRLAGLLGLDEDKLRELMAQRVTESNINEFGRFELLKATVDKARAKAFFEKRCGRQLPPPKVNMETDKLLREFILKGGFDIEES
ncbi:MAG: HsdR family type I site-specific deoxyribonuclease [bacterium]|nr:HsdR family type I site-specific deoxyribonuclease [bacterium]